MVVSSNPISWQLIVTGQAWSYVSLFWLSSFSFKWLHRPSLTIALFCRRVAVFQRFFWSSARINVKKLPLTPPLPHSPSQHTLFHSLSHLLIHFSGTSRIISDLLISVHILCWNYEVIIVTSQYRGRQSTIERRK